MGRSKPCAAPQITLVAHLDATLRLLTVRRPVNGVSGAVLAALGLRLALERR